jgi:hypothetical protein
MSDSASLCHGLSGKEVEITGRWPIGFKSISFLCILKEAGKGRELKLSVDPYSRDFSQCSLEGVIIWIITNICKSLTLSHPLTPLSLRRTLGSRLGGQYLAWSTVTTARTTAQKNEVICWRIHPLKVGLGLKPRSVGSKSLAPWTAGVTRAQAALPLDKGLPHTEGILWFKPW